MNEIAKNKNTQHETPEEKANNSGNPFFTQKSTTPVAITFRHCFECTAAQVRKMICIPKKILPFHKPKANMLSGYTSSIFLIILIRLIPLVFFG